MNGLTGSRFHGSLLRSGVATRAIALTIVGSCASSAAFAQDSAAPATPVSQVSVAPANGCAPEKGKPLPANCAPEEIQSITITGTRIRSPNIQSSLPITSVGGEQFFQTGNISIGDKLAELPQIASTFTQANSTRFLGTAGLNLLDLRGLGTQRTLVLVNGRRHVGGDVLNTGLSVDTNTIPTDLIERVDVVTGGNSAVYGSDAIAGVVNFVLKDHFQGFQLRGQGGQSTYGDAGSYFVSALAGKNFASGRGNIAVNVEFARRDQAWGDDRTWLRQALVQVDSDGPLDPNGSDGNPDFVLNRDFRSSTFSNTGTIVFGPGGTFGCGVDPQGSKYSCPYTFQPNGDLVPITGQRVGLGPNGEFIGGTGEGFFDHHQIQITPALKRYNVNLVGHFEVSPAVVPFVEAKYSRTDTSGTGGNGPAFIAGTALQDVFQFVGGYNRETISIDNPYLTDQARQTICGIRAQRGQTCPDTLRFGVSEGLLGLGNRTENAERNTFRIVGGIRGDLGNNWSYEASLNYGRLHETTKILGNLDTQRALLALDAVRDPTTGQIVCRSQIDPNAAFGGSAYADNLFSGPDAAHPDPNFQQRLEQDIAACVPVNVLGGNFTQAQKNYLLVDTTSIGKISQFDALAFISGDSSKWFELPGGPIGIVVGGEYREDNLFFQEDPLVEQGYTFYNSIPTFSAPKEKVTEGFGEIRLPVLKDLPLVHELEISAAARASNYNLGKTGTVWAYNANAVYSPVAGLRFRGNYARAVRAPNQGELFTPFGQNFSLVSDPCDVNNIGANPNREKNCQAQGIPAGGAPLNYSDSLLFLQGGNDKLAAEKSDSITLGGVLTPHFLPGFSASVDYYSIRVKQAIQFLDPQFILNQCYDLPSLQNPFCALFKRASGTEVGHDGLPFGILDNSLHVEPFNFAKLETSGLDMEFAYSHKFARLGQFDTKLTWTHSFSLTNFVNPADPKFGDRILGELGSPIDAFNWSSSLRKGPVTLGYEMRYIGRMTVANWEATHSFQGRPPEDADFSDKQFYSPVFYHNVRFAYDVGHGANFYIGVDNLGNYKPQYGLSGIGGGSAIYDAIGRFYYGGFVVKLK